MTLTPEILAEWERDAIKFVEIVGSGMENHLFEGDEIPSKRILILISALKEAREMAVPARS